MTNAESASPNRIHAITAVHGGTVKAGWLPGGCAALDQEVEQANCRERQGQHRTTPSRRSVRMHWIDSCSSSAAGSVMTKAATSCTVFAVRTSHGATNRF